MPASHPSPAQILPQGDAEIKQAGKNGSANNNVSVYLSTLLSMQVTRVVVILRCFMQNAYESGTIGRGYGSLQIQ